MEFSDLATVSGKGGLFKVVSPTKSGLILESLDEHKKKLVVSSQITKVSILAEISIYTNDEEGSIPLDDVLRKIHKEFDGDLGVTKNSDSDELKAFFRHVLPDYDEERVYVSDIKKVVNWYGILGKEAPEILLEQNKEEVEEGVQDAEVIEESTAKDGSEATDSSDSSN